MGQWLTNGFFRIFGADYSFGANPNLDWSRPIAWASNPKTTL